MSCPCRQCQCLGPRESDSPEVPEDIECKFCCGPLLSSEEIELDYVDADDEGPGYWRGWHLACVKQKGVSK